MKYMVIAQDIGKGRKRGKGVRVRKEMDYEMKKAMFTKKAKKKVIVEGTVETLVVQFGK